MAFSEWVYVESTDLKAVRYDDDGLVLEIEFHSGGVYQYYDVPEAIFHELLNSDSKGKYFHANIKNNYRYARI